MKQMERLGWVCGGAAGAALVVVTQLATRSEVDAWHRASLICLAFALPLLCAVVLRTSQTPSLPHDDFWINILAIGGAGVFWIAMLALFGSFGPYFMLAFAGASFVSSALWWKRP